jgi:hypothetical protein
MKDIITEAILFAVSFLRKATLLPGSNDRKLLFPHLNIFWHILFWQSNEALYVVTRFTWWKVYVATDKWKGYVPLKKDWQITQTLSNKGERMKMLHTHIINLKGWLRGIHHKCSKGRLQYYLDEYHFRFNRRGATKDIFDKLLVKAMSILPHPYAAVRICEQLPNAIILIETRKSGHFLILKRDSS